MEDQNDSQNPDIERLADLYLKDLQSPGAQYSARRYIEAYDRGEIAARSAHEDPEIQGQRQFVHEKCYLATKLALSRIEAGEKPAEDKTANVTSIITDVPGNLTEANPDWAKAETIEAKDFRDITGMNWEALKSTETIGEIRPPTSGCFLVGMRRPLPNGSAMIEAKSQEGVMVPFSEDEDEFTADPEDVSVKVPAKMVDKVFPVPAGYSIAGCDDEDGIYVSEKNSDNPLVVRNLDATDGKTVRYILRPSTPVKAKVEPLRPTAEEQAYWAKVLPLPPEIRKECADNPREIPAIIGGFVQSRYRYVCNDALGKFIKAHTDDLPLIVDELKVGHCNILSWATAAYFRQLGVPAVMTNDEVTGFDGSGFMKKYTHARVALASTEGEIFFFDPAAHCFVDRALNPDFFNNSLFTELEEKYRQAKTEAEKRDILRQFNQMHLQSRYESRPVRMKAFANLRGSSIAIKEKGQTAEPAKTPPRRIYDPNIDLGFSLKKTTGDLSLKELSKEVYELNVGGYHLEDMADFPLTGAEPLPEDMPNSGRVNLTRLYNYFAERGLIFENPVSMSILNDYQRAQEENEFANTVHSLFGNMFTNLSAIAYAIDPKLYEKAIGEFKTIDNLGVFLAGNGWGIAVKKDGSMDALGQHAGVEDLKHLIPVPINFLFTKEFKALVAKYSSIPIEDLIEVVGQKNVLCSWQMVIFVALLAQSLKDPKVKTKIMAEFGLDEEFFEKAARATEDTRGAKPKIKVSDPKLAKMIAQSRKPSTQPGLPFNRKIYNQSFYAEAKEKAKATHNAENLVRKAAPKSYAQRLDNGSWTLAEYDPNVHDAKDIAWQISAKAQRVIVKQPEMAAIKSEPVYVYFDVDCEEAHMPSLYQTLVPTLEGFKKYAKAHNCEIYISTNKQNSYLKLEQSQSVEVLANLMVASKGECQDFRVQDKGRSEIPKNLIYLSGADGKVAAVKHQLKSKVHAYTFKDAGLQIYPKLREDWALNSPMFI